MPNVTISPNMMLPVPIVSVDPGPDWANNINACLGILDQHDHSSGEGVKITPNGLNINSDLTIGGNNLTNVNTTSFVSLSGVLSGNLDSIYVVGRELYYNDGAGNHVQITNGGNVNAGAGSITGLPSGSASASFSGNTFTWQSATNTAANMDGGSFIFRQVSAGANGITVSSPNSLAAPYGLVWPTGEPLVTSLLKIDTSGNMSYETYDQVGQAMTTVGANAIMNTQTVFSTTNANWTAYTPTLAGVTTSSVSFLWRKIGQNVEVMGQGVITGTSATAFEIPLPGSFTVLSTIPQIQRQNVGSLLRNTAATSFYHVIADPNLSYVLIGIQDGTSNPTSATNGTGMGNVTFSVNFSVPVN